MKVYQPAGVTQESDKIHLAWQPGFSVYRKPFKKPRRLRAPRKTAALGSAQQYDFILEDPRPKTGDFLDEISQESAFIRPLTPPTSNKAQHGLRWDGTLTNDGGYAESGAMVSETTGLTAFEPAYIASTIPGGIHFRSLAHRFDPMFQRCAQRPASLATFIM